ncbi:MAG: phenylalanine--tRNA ligase subunit alpha, partial [Acholeplasma sp.]
MKEKIDLIVKSLGDKLSNALSLNDLEALRVEYLGKSGILTSQMALIRTLPNDEKPKFGQWINEAKQAIEAQITLQKNILLTQQMNEQLKTESIDVSLPGLNFKKGSLHPLTIVTQDLEDYFVGLGYRVAEGPELESDKYNFEMMNLASDHPAREMHDSFYVTTNTLLRTHTSPIQARYMEQSKGQPIAIIAPGKTYRRDPDDRTHSHQFMQCEGLVINEGVTFAHLKDTLLGMAKHIFGDTRTIRLRPSYFPFTEPSVE